MTKTNSRLLAALQASEKKTNEKPASEVIKHAPKPTFFGDAPHAQDTQASSKSAPPSSANKTQLTPAYLQSVGKLKSNTKSQNPSKISRVDISVAGTTHRIGCTHDKVENLRKNTELLNQKLKNLRLQITGKPPTNEELLVLHCLALYDELADLKATQEDTCALADKLLAQIKALG